MTLLKAEVDYYEHIIVQHPNFKKLSSISELCQWLVKTQKSLFYPYVYRVITLVLTLLVFTVTIEWVFSTMNIIKNSLRNKMEDDFSNGFYGFLHWEGDCCKILYKINHKRLLRFKGVSSSILINVLKCLRNTYFVCYTLLMFI